MTTITYKTLQRNLVLLRHVREPPTVSKSTFYPFFTIGRDLLFPDGYGRLQGINDIATGIKSFGSMWRGYHNNDTGLTYLQSTEAVRNRNALYPPAPFSFGNNRANLLLCHLWIDIIFKVAYLFTS